jgi:hypothetical protein
MLSPLATKTQRAPGRIGFSGEQLVNYLPEPKEGGVSPLMLAGREGCTELVTLTAGKPVRGIIEMDGKLYASCGGRLWEVSTAGATSDFGALPDAHARMAGNGTQVAIATDGRYYVATSTGVEIITPGALPDRQQDVAFSDQFIIVAGSTPGRDDGLTISGLNDAASFDAIDIAFAEDEPDRIVALQKQGQYIWVLGSRGYEVFFNSGDPAFPFQPTGTISGNHGCKSRESVCTVNDVIFWVRPDGGVMAAGDFAPQNVALPEIMQIFADHPVLSSFGATDRGHEIAVWRFADRPSLVYDVTAGAWTEYATGADFGPWLATCAATVDGVQYLGTSDGRIVTRSRLVYDDAGLVLPARAVSIPVSVPGEYFAISRLVVQIAGGSASIGRTPEAMIETSRDGQAWTRGRWVKLGNAGEHYKRARLHGLGAFRDRFQFRVTITDPVERDIYGVSLV